MTDRKNWKVGASTAAVGKADSEIVYAYAKAGLQAMEISLPWDRYDELDLAAMKKVSQETGVALWSLHLPFDNTLSIAHADPVCRQNALDTDTKWIRQSAKAGITYCIIHPGTEPTAEADRAERLKESAENLYKLAEIGQECGVVLCVEDLPRTCPGNCSDEMLQLLAAHPALRSCFDTNHLLKESHESYLNAVGSSVVTLHVSDYDFVDERHQLPGEGMIDWEKLMTHLETLGYNGPWMYELSLKPTPNRRTGPELTLEDLISNFRKLCKM